MTSFNKLLEDLAPDAEPRRSLVSPVMARIAAGHRRARILRIVAWTGLAISANLAAIAIARGNTPHVIQLGLAHRAAAVSHLGLYLRAVLEAAPILPLGALLLGLIGVAYVSRPERQVAFGRWGMAVISAIGIFGVSTSAYAATTADHTPGAALQELERTVDDLGQLTVTIDGQTYGIGYDATSPLSDSQIRAQAEAAALNKAVAPLDKLGGNDINHACMCKVTAISSNQITFDFYESATGSIPPSPNHLTFDDDTKFFIGAKESKVGPELTVGQLIVIDPKSDGTTVSYISLPQYPANDYLQTAAFSSVAPKHNKNGKCYNNEADLCPNLAHARDVFGYTPDESTVPSKAEIREVFGVVQTVDEYNIMLKDSRGEIWTLLVGPNFTPSVAAGYGLRVEFWQYKTDFASRRVVDRFEEIQMPYGKDLTKERARELIAAGKLNYDGAYNQFRGMQVIEKRYY